ncbi:hypothetical protein PAMP_008901 [Pampus punctatissimus]
MWRDVEIHFPHDSHQGCTGDNSEPTSISISGTVQRPARPPPPPPTRQPVENESQAERWAEAGNRGGEGGWEKGMIEI